MSQQHEIVVLMVNKLIYIVLDVYIKLYPMQQHSYNILISLLIIYQLFVLLWL